jgi:hypothetical protein
MDFQSVARSEFQGIEPLEPSALQAVNGGFREGPDGKGCTEHDIKLDIKLPGKDRSTRDLW